MGCDIHGFIEVRIDGFGDRGHIWDGVAMDISWERYYNVFAAMGNTSRKPSLRKMIFAESRGLPNDISWETKGFLNGDEHDCSWLSYVEVEQLSENYRYVVGLQATLAMMRVYAGDGRVTRFVFWFDN